MSQECRKTVPAGTKSNRIGRGIAVILGAATLTACGSEASALPRDALSAWEIYAREQCRNQEERFAAIRFAPLSGHGTANDLVERHLADGKGGYMTADFNADSDPDFVLITPGYGCVGSVPAYGDRGAPVDFVVSTASGYRVFDGFVGRIGPGMIARRGDRDVLDLPAGFSGRCGAVSQVTWGWTGSGVGPLERRNDRGALVDGEGCAEAAAPDTAEQ